MNFETARRMTGHKLAAGFEGTVLPDEMIRLIKEHKVSNIILFRRNIASKEQLKKLCADIQALVLRETGEAALISLDQEGGGVSRLPGECPVFPSQMALAATGNPLNAYEAARMTAGQLLELGVNFNLAPVMDLNLNPRNPVIGTRSYSDQPELAAAFGAEAIRGYREIGVLAAAKHFPGHGDTAVDSHVGLPTVDKTLDEMWETELKSFEAAIKAEVPAVMVSHILYPKFQKESLPATMSRDIITGLLKEKMGFQGLAVSDCMMMDAILKYYGTVEGCLASAKAGMDLIFVSHSPALAARAAEAIRDALLSGEIDAEEAALSEQKMLAAKRKALAAQQAFSEPPQTEELKSLSARMAKEALCLYKGKAPLNIGSAPLFVGMPPVRASQASDPGAKKLSFAGRMAEAVGGRAHELNAELDLEETAVILSEAHSASCVILGVQGIRLSEAEAALLDGLRAQSKPVVLVTLRTPYPLSQLPEGMSGLAAFDYNEDSLSALTDAFSGRFLPSGKLPVRL